MSFWREVFSDDTGRGSSQRLFNGIGVIVGAAVVLYLTVWKELSEGIFGIFVLATGGVYGIGQWRQSQVEIEKVKAENPQPQQVPVPVPVAPLGPTTVIQVGQKPDSAVNDVNMDVQGDVNMRKQ